jgi:hypothetical protein
MFGLVTIALACARRRRSSCRGEGAGAPETEANR